MHQLLLAASLVYTASALFVPPTYEVDKEKVYYGDTESFSKPATLDRDKVFAEISAYKQIENEGLTRKEPRYWILLRKANDVFSKVVAKVAEDDGYDLVAENGSVKKKGREKAAPDLTESAIEAIQEVEEG